MIRTLLLFFICILPLFCSAQSPLYEFRDLEKGNFIPNNINSSRTAVIVSVNPENSSPVVEGDWKKFSDQVHSALYRMSIDAVIYINENDFSSGNSTKNFYEDILSKRGVKNLIFVTQKNGEVELLCSPYSGGSNLISNSEKVYLNRTASLNRLMLEFAREVKRAENPIKNFLIPDRPTYLDALSIVENSNLKNYPGQIRRNKLAIEKFQEVAIPENASDELTAKINQHNSSVQEKNKALANLIEPFPYETELIEYLSDEDLLRNRYQFVLRNLFASGESIRSMLKYKVPLNEAGYVSVVPVMPDNTSIKTFPRKALLHKFYIRQNIAKNVYVGEWDADEDWESAFQNYMGNMIQYFNKGN